MQAKMPLDEVLMVIALGSYVVSALGRRIRDDAKRAASGPLRGDAVYVGGQQAEYTDFNDALYARFPLIVGIVLILTYGFLFFAFQAPDVALSEIVVSALALPVIVLTALRKIREHEQGREGE